MEVAPAAPTHVRRTDAEEQQWLGLEAYVADLDRHLVVDREGRQVRNAGKNYHDPGQLV